MTRTPAICGPARAGVLIASRSATFEQSATAIDDAFARWDRSHLHEFTLADDTASIILAKTADRSVLGCMNDMTFMCETVTSRSGGLASTDIADLNLALRRNINSARGYQLPIEMTAQRLRARR